MTENKKGFLLGEETVKLILAVIALLFLILFVVYLYNNLSGNKDLDDAKSSLAHLVSEINAGSSEAEVYNPKDWLVFSFSPSTNDGYVPQTCSNNGWTKCLCFCINDLGAATSPHSVCENYVTCQQSDFSVDGQSYWGAGTGVKIPILDSLTMFKTNSILISNPPIILSINQQTKTISLEQNGA